MKSKLLAILTLSVLTLNLAGSAVADVKRKTYDSAPLVAMLPAADGVAVIDVRRFMTTALPQLLSGNQTMLAEINKGLEEAKAKTGIDYRQFDTVAAAVTAQKIKDKEYDFEAVIIARGQLNSGALLSAAKLAANGKYKEEKVGDRTIFIFAAREIVDKNAPQAGGKTGGLVNKAVGGISKEMAATAIDANTIAFGDLSKVKETLAGTTKVGTDLTSLLAKNSSVMAFAGKVPAGMSSFLPLENDELGKNIDSIQYLYGSMDVVGTTTTLNATAKTTAADQAVGLKDTLEGLQMLGKAFLGNAKGADKEVYARLVDSVKFSATGNEVSMNLSIAQSDIDFLFGLLSK